MSSRELDTMRAIEWEHAKGNLRAMLVTYYDDDGQYTELQKAIKDFIKKLEDEIGI